MCIIIAKPIGASLPDRTLLDHCQLSNKDGIGIAWTTDGVIKIKKDFKDVQSFDSFLNENVQKNQACIIHFRKATAGKSDEGNRHPFPLTRRSKRLRALETTTDIAIAHNGTFKDLSDHKKYSDTLLFIKNILSDPIIRNNLHSEAIQELLKGYIDTSRLAIMDRLGNILKLGTFYTEYGLFFSNENYKYTHSGYSGYGGCSDGYWSNGRSQCVVCLFYLRDEECAFVKTRGYICLECLKKEALKRDKEDELKLITNNRKGDDNA